MSLFPKFSHVRMTDRGIESRNYLIKRFGGAEGESFYFDFPYHPILLLLKTLRQTSAGHSSIVLWFPFIRVVEKEINGGNPAVPGNDEIGSGVSRRITRSARYPSDQPAIARFRGLGNWLIEKVRVSSLDRACDAIDLVTATVNSLAGVVEHTVFGVDLVDGRAPTSGVVFTEDVAKITDQQGRYAVGHGASLGG